MTKTKKVFITTHLFTAFIDKADKKHATAAAFFRFFAQEEYQLYTDYLTLINAYESIAKTISPRLARSFLKSISFGNINLIYPDEIDMKSAIRALTGTKNTTFTFPQALINVIAERREIPYICSLETFHNLFGIALFTLPK